MHPFRKILAGAASPLIFGVALFAQETIPPADRVPIVRAELPDAPSVLASIPSPEPGKDDPLLKSESPSLDLRWHPSFDADNPSSAAGKSGETPPTLKGLPRQLLVDQKFLWTRPFRLKKADVPWVLALGGSTAALIATDSTVARDISANPPGSGYAFSHRVSQIGDTPGDLGVASAFYLAGHFRHDERARATGLKSYRALADSLIITEVLKSVTQRSRPTTANGTVRVDNAEGGFFEGGSSFPSGHAAGAWAVGTVVACQYPHKRWVAVVAYSTAGLVSVSRVFERRHFPSDAFFGSALGFMIGQHACHS